MYKRLLPVLMTAVLFLLLISASVLADQDGNFRYCNMDEYGCWVTEEDGRRSYIMFWSEEAKEFFIGANKPAVICPPPEDNAAIMDLGPAPAPVREKKPVPELTPTPTPTQEPDPDPTPVPTEQPDPTPTTVPTEQPDPTPTTVPTEQPDPDPTPIPTQVPDPDPTPVPTQEPEPEPGPEPEPVPEPEPEPLLHRTSSDIPKYLKRSLSYDGFHPASYSPRTL